MKQDYVGAITVVAQDVHPPQETHKKPIEHDFIEGIFVCGGTLLFLCLILFIVAVWDICKRKIKGQI